MILHTSVTWKIEYSLRVLVGRILSPILATTFCEFHSLEMPLIIEPLLELYHNNSSSHIAYGKLLP